MYHVPPTPTEVLGSDGNRYLIEQERVGYDAIELSLIPIKVRVSKDYYEFGTRVDRGKELVERYINRMKHEYGPDRKTLIEIYGKLAGSKVNNHFDYLIVLQEILPKLEKLLQ